MCNHFTAKTIIDSFNEVCFSAGQEDAVICGEIHYSYQEIYHKSNQIANYLSNKANKEIIGIMIPRGINLIVGLLGILKAGYTFLPIDMELPPDRIKYMLNDSHCKTLLVEGNNQPKWLTDIDFIDVSTISLCEDESICIIDPRSAAYVMYTSGSTGKPKGVIISHKALYSFSKSIISRLNFSYGSKILAATTITFDISILELLIPLISKMIIVVADERTAKNPRLLISYIYEQKIEIIQMTPSRMQLLLEATPNKKWLDHVKQILIGGECFPVPLLKNLQQESNAQIYNLYGPTEATIWASVSNLTNKDLVDIGHGFSEARMIIIDDNLCETKESSGEICIVGEQLADGYLGKPELTKEKFVTLPGTDGTLAYRTGDIGKIIDDGTLIFLGRTDDQVKIRGHRIELNEITHYVLVYPGIKNAVTIALESKHANKYLCVYYISDEDIDLTGLKNHLKKFLTVQMIPEEFIRMGSFPITESGKIDKNKLIERGV